jgi:NADP-dependent 3-hydroxy acid dehydrogenase YdfG
MKLEGGHVVMIGGSSGIGLAAARLPQDEGAEVTIAGRSEEKLIQAQRELGRVHTAVMDITDEGAVEKALAGLRQVDHVLISAGTLRNGTIVNNGGSCPLLLPIVSSPSNVYISCRKSFVLTH